MKKKEEEKLKKPQTKWEMPCVTILKNLNANYWKLFFKLNVASIKKSTRTLFYRNRAHLKVHMGSEGTLSPWSNRERELIWKTYMYRFHEFPLRNSSLFQSWNGPMNKIEDLKINPSICGQMIFSKSTKLPCVEGTTHLCQKRVKVDT